MDYLKFLIEKTYAFNLPKYAKVNLLIKFIKNSTLMGQFTFWQLKANFTVNNKFYNDLYMMGRQVSSPIIFDPPVLTPPFEILLNPQEKLLFIATFDFVKRLVPHSQCYSKIHVFENG